MKARFVYEGLSFQRGLDPKEALNIGRPSWDTLKKGDIIKCTKFVQASVSEKTLYNTIRHYWHGNIFQKDKYYILLKDPVIYEDGRIHLNTRYIYHGNGWDSITATRRQLSDRFQILTHHEADMIKDAYGLNESLSFERGKDPKSALNIGAISKINDIINNEDQLEDLINEMDSRLESAMGIYLPAEESKEIAKMWLSNLYEGLPHYEFKVLSQSSDDEDDNVVDSKSTKINYDVADLKAEGWEVFWEENNFGQIEIILTREIK
jgi:hypothetical protein